MKDSYPQLTQFLSGKSDLTLTLLDHFLAQFETLGAITVEPTKTMIGISNSEHRIAWITQLGKNFVHIVFPFKEMYPDNLCFQKIAQVPGNIVQYNHHFRMYAPEDVNQEVLNFMCLALNS